MTAAEIIALCTGLPSVIGAVTALIIALRSNASVSTTTSMLNAHLLSGRHTNMRGDW